MTKKTETATAQVVGRKYRDGRKFGMAPLVSEVLTQADEDTAVYITIRIEQHPIHYFGNKTRKEVYDKFPIGKFLEINWREDD